MLNLLNKHRIIFHFILGYCVGDSILRLIWRESFYHPREAGFGGLLDFVGNYAAPMGVAAFFSWLANFLTEDGQLRIRRTMLGFDYETIRKSLYMGIPAGIVLAIVPNDAYDWYFIITEWLVVVGLVVYYFVDAKKRKAK